MSGTEGDTEAERNSGTDRHMCTRMRREAHTRSTFIRGIGDDEKRQLESAFVQALGQVTNAERVIIMFTTRTFDAQINEVAVGIWGKHAIADS